MSARGRQFGARVLRREQVSEHLVRLVLGGPELAGFKSTGVLDEWVGLVVPGQFQSRYYTVRDWSDGEMTVDVVLHESGLVTEWAQGRCVGDTVTLGEPKGSFDPPPDAAWWLLVADLTGLPAIARITRSDPPVPVRVLVEAPEELPGYLPDGVEVTWLEPPGPGQSGLAAAVEALEWPEGEGYFWMAGESAQMRAIRKHLMRVLQMPSSHYDVMGYWRATTRRQPRAVDPGPIYRAGKAAGRSDEEIWAEYDAARERHE